MNNMNSRSFVYNRHLRILDILKDKGSVSVDELAEALDVSAVTIRRDLDVLDQRGFLVRTHGGALPMNQRVEQVPERQFNEKDILNVMEKKRIAEKAVELVQDGEIIFMNSGSTLLFFIKALRNKRVKIITNNAAAIDCEHDPLVEFMFLGGEYREQSRSFVGEIPINTLKNFYSNHTFLGTNGLDLERGLTTSNYQECSINQAMIENTHGKVIVLADSSKLGKVSNFISSELNKVDVVVTDTGCPDSIKKQLIEKGIEVILS